MGLAGARGTRAARPAYAYMSRPRWRPTQISTFAGFGLSTPNPPSKGGLQLFCRCGVEVLRRTNAGQKKFACIIVPARPQGNPSTAIRLNVAGQKTNSKHAVSGLPFCCPALQAVWGHPKNLRNAMRAARETVWGLPGRFQKLSGKCTKRLQKRARARLKEPTCAGRTSGLGRPKNVRNAEGRPSNGLGTACKASETLWKMPTKASETV